MTLTTKIVTMLPTTYRARPRHNLRSCRCFYPLAVLAWVLLLQPLSSVAQAQTQIRGPVTHVRDGDTIKIGPIAVRLEGVSAPELREKLGQPSKMFMQGLVMGRKVTCRLNGSKTYDRFVGVCFLNGRDIGATIISEGLARDCPRYSGGRYSKFETAAARLRIKLPKYCRPKTYRK